MSSLADDPLPRTSILARLRSLGVPPGMPRSPARYVILNNTICLVVIVLSLLFAARNLFHESDNLIALAGIQAAGAIPFTACLLLNHRRQYWLATAALLVVGATLLVAGAFLAGRNQGQHLVLPVLTIAPFLLFQREHFPSAVLFCAAAAVVSVATFKLAPAGPEPRAAFGVALCAVLALLGLSARRGVQTAEDAAEREYDRAQALLLNILPESVVDRLERSDAVIADRYDEVTVLFADLVGFTQLSERHSAAQIVEILNVLFSRFDRLAERHGVEKIKTIGDAYMAVAGLPEIQPDHASRIAAMAIDMLDLPSVASVATDAALTVRIGIHTGPAVAGVIGESKFAYDVWGRTVNTASRMESHGVPGRIQISDATRRLLPAEFTVEPRGEIDVKGVGTMTPWFLIGKDPS